ncbi:radical SAM protein [Desulfobotulus mexicanus]|uniref:Radical SAM protein n=1 Tax=Desulfobotulus mexicanus TaxID=2586642 RepID=A0A5S5MFC3_9BACT|nr:radical SAM protein [Desulfobotulus mexicanus]TYT74388.1 radical SAM protein [Desulfobotulus mexicanus]
MSKVRLGPDGVHIFDRDSGTNVLLDEIVPPRDRWTFSPRQVSIALTNACDLECTHCYASKTPARLDFESLKQWMLELDSAGCFGVGFGGGEPMLYPKIHELCEFGRTYTNLAITMTSHGHRLNVPLVEALRSSVNFLRISMDGVHHTYEKIRGRSFPSLLEKLSLIKGKIPFGINYVVNEATIIDLTKAAEIAEEFHAKELLILPEAAHGRGKAVTQQTLTQLSDWIGSYRGSLQLSISSAHSELVRSQSPLPCEAEEIAFAHIDANGILKRCSFDSGGQVINDKGIMYAFNKLIEERKSA